MAHSIGVNERARTGFAKGSTYDQFRPTYSETAVQFLLENLGIAGQKGAKILDLAAGTGKFTEALARRDEQYEITAVEPVEGMRKVLADKKLPGVTVKDGTADSIPLEEGSVDAIICAQSFHWFANKPALDELHRVLRRHSSLGLIWNIDDNNATRDHKATTNWEKKTHDIIWTFDDDAPRFRSDKWRQVFKDQVKMTPLTMITGGHDQLFSLPLGENVEKYSTRLSKEQIWERFTTLSQIAVLEGEERERVYRKFMDALNDQDVETDENGDVELHGETVMVWTSKIPEKGRDELIDVEEPKSTKPGTT